MLVQLGAEFNGTVQQTASLFDNLVGAGEQHGQHSANRKIALWRLFGFLDFVSRSGCKSLARSCAPMRGAYVENCRSSEQLPRITVHVIECLPAVATVEDVGQAIAIMVIMVIVPMSHELRTADHTLVYRALTGGAAFTFVNGLAGRRCRTGCTVLVLHVCTAIGIG